MTLKTSRLAARVAVGALGALTVLPALAGAQSLLGDKLQVHGYLTQGFGATDSLPILGIGSRGSADYRAAALQLRLAATSHDIAVVQLANRRMGVSQLNAMASSVVDVQWAYYQRRLPAGLTAKLGRAPVPRGIFNEVRKVGTVLPFYRAPYNFYTESFETVDGALLRHDASLGAWALETSAFAGTMPFMQKATAAVYQPTFGLVNGAPRMTGVRPVGRDTTYLMDRRIDATLGGQLWLSTPVEGLRVGLGGTRGSLNSLREYSGQPGRVTSSIVQGAVDGNFARFQLRGEWEQQQAGEFLYTAHYGQGGVKLTDKLSLNVQREEAQVHVAYPAPIQMPDGRVTAGPTSRRAYRLVRDVAVGANYAFRPDVILKVEGHDNKGANYDRSVEGAPRGRYFLTSLALSF